uniref:ethanolamine kinase n=1 Tax=Arcella intermedia TaxID=1963864 RepID=A0A6B2L923_9EUKA
MIKLCLPYLEGISENPTITITKITIGTINYCFKVTIDDTKVMVRIYGSELSNVVSDRVREFSLLLLANRFGYGPKVHLRFNNGYVVSFIEGNPLEIVDFRKKDMIALIAEKMAEWHNIKMPENLVPHLTMDIWQNIEKWIQLAQSFELDISLFTKEIELLKNELQGEDQLCLTHNDLNSGNVIYNAGKEEGTVTFVDYEFSGLGNRYFDLANHFCEWCGLDFDYSLFPTREQQLEFLVAYLTNLSPTKEEPNQKELESLQEIVNKYQLLSHYFWGLWAKIMAEKSNSNIFDYKKYSETRMKLYFQVKKELLPETSTRDKTDL